MIIVQKKALEIWVSIFTEAYKIHHLFTVRSTCLKEVPIKKKWCSRMFTDFIRDLVN